MTFVLVIHGKTVHQIHVKIAEDLVTEVEVEQQLDELREAQDKENASHMDFSMMAVATSAKLVGNSSSVRNRETQMRVPDLLQSAW